MSEPQDVSYLEGMYVWMYVCMYRVFGIVWCMVYGVRCMLQYHHTTSHPPTFERDTYGVRSTPQYHLDSRHRKCSHNQRNTLHPPEPHPSVRPPLLPRHPLDPRGYGRGNRLRTRQVV
ncbi:hypothetical protein BO94DRAFT_241973 [Aspergillus sclerotioniger CBS 115572]|uniref:Uncharacterized protein n=1 Tax=Aspergillus sclerotioniger CBS 115572 TaxID=1450535 RepID=A0A317VJ08_9EURO|nr:hypothetical protein BO94DRAFT_241973 [Aspergillus sclerotioniger CBS 115572]PWY73167.1 hypothetical protein BO94DRAFT_241973 [Aspergillus sclerotioniger CBS 115572]